MYVKFGTMKPSRTARLCCALILIQFETYGAMTIDMDTTTSWQTTTTDVFDYTTADTTTEVLDYSSAGTTDVVDTSDTTTTSPEEAPADDHMIIIILTVCVGVLVAIVVGLVLLVVRLKRNAKAKGMQRNVETAETVNENMYELLGNEGKVIAESGNESNPYETLGSQIDPAVNKDQTDYDKLNLYENTTNRNTSNIYTETCLDT